MDVLVILSWKSPILHSNLVFFLRSLGLSFILYHSQTSRNPHQSVSDPGDQLLYSIVLDSS